MSTAATEQEQTAPLEIYRSTLASHERRITKLEQDTVFIRTQYDVLMADSEEIKRSLGENTQATLETLRGIQRIFTPAARWVWFLLTILAFGSIIFGIVETTYLRNIARNSSVTTITAPSSRTSGNPNELRRSSSVPPR